MLSNILSAFQSTCSTLYAYAFNHKTHSPPVSNPEPTSFLEPPFGTRDTVKNPLGQAPQENDSLQQAAAVKGKEADFKQITIPLKTKPLVCSYSANAQHWPAIAEELAGIPLHQAKTLQHGPTRGLSRTAQNTAFSPNHPWRATYTGYEIELWSIAPRDTKAPKLLHAFSEGLEKVTSVAFSPDSKWLAAGNTDGSVQMWSMQTDVPVLKQTFSYRPTLRQALSESTINSVTFSPDGKWLLSCNGSVRIWPTSADITVRPFLLLDDRVNAIAFAPNSRYLALGSDECSIKIYRFTAPYHFEPIDELEGHAQEVESIAFSPNGKWLAAYSQNGAAKVWTVEENTDTFRLRHASEGYASSKIPDD